MQMLAAFADSDFSFTFTDQRVLFEQHDFVDVGTKGALQTRKTCQTAEQNDFDARLKLVRAF
jgi:hypothetical protein